MHLSVDCAKPLDALRADLVKSLAAHGLVVASVSDAKERLREAGVAHPRGTFVVEIEGALPELRAASSGGTDGSTYRVAGFERPEGGTRLSTLRPSHLMHVLGHPELEGGALRLERVLETVFAEAIR